LETRTRVVVYGNSLHLAGIAASLKADANLEVICVDPRVPGARQMVKELKPTVIAFDMSGTEPGLEAVLMCKRRGMLLIGVDANSDELVVLSRRCHEALNMDDLANVIHQKAAQTGLRKPSGTLNTIDTASWSPREPRADELERGE